MMDLSTEQGQIRHYRDVRARLMAPREVVPKPPRFLYDALQRRATFDAQIRAERKAKIDEMFRIAAEHLREEARRAAKAEPGDVAAIVSIHFNLTRKEVVGKSHHKAVVRARHAAMFILRQQMKWSFSKIGKYFCRDHSTVVSAVQRVAELRLIDPVLDAKITAAEQECLSIFGPAIPPDRRQAKRAA